ncbi:hypothetical protein M513_14241, partial [Trichuris suis]
MEMSDFITEFLAVLDVGRFLARVRSEYGREIHKTGVPLRPVVCSTNSVTSKLCTYLTSMLRPYTGKRSSYVKNSKEFCNEIRRFHISSSEIL